MTKQKRSTLKSYFRTGAYPTEQQFSHVLDSYVHKDDTIGMDRVEGLSEALDSKAEKAVTDLKDYAETGKVLPLGSVYVYYGMPVHCRAFDALDTDFDPEAQEGDTTEVIVFCCRHSDDSRSGKGTFYIVYYSSPSGYAYMTSFTSQNVPEDILRAFGEANATPTADGLMSKEDKGKLDGIKTVNIANYIGAGKVLPLGEGYSYYYGYPKAAPVCVESFVLPTDGSGNIIDDETSQNNGAFYVVRIHRQFVPQEVNAIVVWKNDGTYYGDYEYQTSPAALLRAMNDVQYIPIEGYIRNNSRLPLGEKYIYTYSGTRITLDLVTLRVSGNKIIMPPSENGDIALINAAPFWVFNFDKGLHTLPDGNPYYWVWKYNGHFYGELTVAENDALNHAYGKNPASQEHTGYLSASDKKKIDAIKILEITNLCQDNKELPRNIGSYNFFIHSGAPVEMRQWDSNSQKYMVFATLGLGDMEEKALGTAPMEYRNSYYVFIDDDNGYYEYLATYGYSNVPIEIARAFHGDETSEPVSDIFLI